MKKKTKRNTNKTKELLIAFVPLLLCLIYFVWMMYTTQYADLNNTYKTNVKFTEYDTFTWGYSDNLYLYNENDSYIMFFGFNKNEESVNELGVNVISSPSDVEITVWERYPTRWFDFLGNAPLKTKQIVDIRTEATIYYSIDEHNNFQHRERTSGVILVLFSFVVSIIWMIFAWEKLRDFVMSLFPLQIKRTGDGSLS